MDDPSSTVERSDLQGVASRLFFIVGTSRSGTTLLQAILNAHSRICIPPETHFFTYEDEFEGGWPHLFSADDIPSFVRFLFREKRRLDDLGLDESAVLRAVERLNITSKQILFLLVAAMYRNRTEEDGDIMGEKTPRHLLQVDTIARRYPEARFLVLFRDPRAKALSERKVPFGSPSLFVSTWRWRRYVREHQRLRRTLSDDRYYQTTYETLVRNSRSEAGRIAAFLNVDFEERMLAFHERGADERGYPAREDWKANTMEPIQEKHIDKWRRELSPREVALVEWTAGPCLREMGYAPAEEGTLSAPGLLATWARDYAKAIRKDIYEVLKG